MTPPTRLGHALTTLAGTLLSVPLVLTLHVPPALASIGDVTTLAGGLGEGPGTTVGQTPNGLALAASTLYVSDNANGVVRAVDLATGSERVVAGGGANGLGDGGLATAATLASPSGLAVDGAGNLLIADSGAHRVRRVGTLGTISTLAGTGAAGFSGDGGAASGAALNNPSGIAVAADGSVYVADTGNNRIRRISPSGTISTVAGTGAAAFSGDGGAATAAALSAPRSLVHTPDGSLLVADTANHRVRRISGALIGTVAGTGVSGFAGDGGPATAARLASPRGLALGDDGAVLVADLFNHRIRRFAIGGSITTAAGSGLAGFSGDGGPATAASLSFPPAVVVGGGDVFVADAGNHRVRRIGSGGVITTQAGTGWPTYGGDGGPATSAQMDSPRDVGTGPSGRVYVSDRNDHRVRSVAPDGTISTLAGTGVAGFSGDGGPASGARLNSPSGVAVDTSGNLFVAEAGNHRVRKVAPGGTISTVAGTGTAGFSGDGGPAISAALRSPEDVAVMPDGTVLIVDAGNRRVRRIGPDGTITTLAGNGSAGYSGDGGPATGAMLKAPASVTPGTSGAFFVADTGNHRIRRVSATGTITTFAGTGVAGFSGDGGSATSANLTSPAGIVWLAEGSLLIADTGSHRVRRVGPDGLISTLAGTGVAGFSGDGASALSARFNFPRGLATGPLGRVVVADASNRRVRTIMLADPTADLSLAGAASPASVPAGDPFTLAFEVANAGPGVADDVGLTVSLPAGMSATDMPGSCAAAGRTVSCDEGDLLPGAQKDVEIVGRATETGRFRVDAVVDWNGIDPLSGNNASSIWIEVRALPAVVSVHPARLNLKGGGIVTVSLDPGGRVDASSARESGLCFGAASAPAARDCTPHNRPRRTGTRLLLQYEVAQTGLRPGDTRACLSGRTTSGLPFEGCASVEVR